MATRAETHRGEQAVIGSLIARLVAQAWAKLLDPHDLKKSTPDLTVAVEAIVRKYGQASAARALTSYRLQRREAGIPGRPPVKMPPLPSAENFVTTVEHALSPLYGPVDTAVIGAAEQALESSVERLVLDQGRKAIIGAVRDDREAKGWARVTEPGACYFCAMLATRGAVYDSRKTADFRAHTKQPNGSGGTCRCHAEPIFNAYEPSAQVRQWMGDWQRLSDELGHSPSVNDWRRDFEGRADGPRHQVGERRRDRRDGTSNPTEPLGFENLSRSQLEHQLSVLEGLKDSDYKRRQIARIQKRLAQLPS